ncbi:MAG: fasciclin domain-containing protein, partial [Pseudomonadota bacterium]
MFHRRVLFVALAATLVSGCASMSSPKSVADTIAATPSLSTLNGLIVKTGLTPTLQGSGPFTVFAPTNDAFKAVPAKTMDA